MCVNHTPAMAAYDGEIYVCVCDYIHNTFIHARLYTLCECVFVLFSLLFSCSAHEVLSPECLYGSRLRLCVFVCVVCMDSQHVHDVYMCMCGVFGMLMAKTSASEAASVLLLFTRNVVILFCIQNFNDKKCSILTHIAHTHTYTKHTNNAAFHHRTQTATYETRIQVHGQRRNAFVFITWIVCMCDGGSPIHFATMHVYIRIDHTISISNMGYEGRAGRTFSI